MMISEQSSHFYKRWHQVPIDPQPAKRQFGAKARHAWSGHLYSRAAQEVTYYSCKCAPDRGGALSKKCTCLALVGIARLRPTLVFVALALIGFAFFLNVQPVAAQSSETGNKCVQDYRPGAVCTANDVRLTLLTIGSVTDPCTSPTDTATVLYRAKVEAGSSDRYDLGVFVALDGGNALSGNSCYHDFLNPVSANNTNLNLTGGAGPFWNGETSDSSDVCGDIQGNTTAFYDLDTLTIQCTDADQNGIVDPVSACLSWDNNVNDTCGGVTSAFPGTNAKCGCESVPTDLQLTLLTVNKLLDTNADLTPDLIGGSTTDPQLAGYTFALCPTGITPPNAACKTATTTSTGQVQFGGIPYPANYKLYETALPTAVPPYKLVNFGGACAPTGEIGLTVTMQTCTALNSQVGSITIVKQTAPNGTTDPFSFTSTGAAPANFNLTGGSSQTFPNLTPGSYTFVESVPAGWDLTNIVCQNGANSTSTITIGTTGGFDAGDTSVAIGLAVGENIICTFTNTQRGKLVVNKVTVPVDTTTPFTITASGTGSIIGNATRTVTGGSAVTYEVTPGSYSVAEQVASGWNKTGDTCQNVSIGAGATVACTITNTKQGHITIIKKTFGGEGVFGFDTNGDTTADFNITTSGNIGSVALPPPLQPGSYTVTELVPAGWDFERIACVGDDNEMVNGATVVIDLDAGENVTCTFENTKQGSITVVKETIAGDGVFDFDTNSSINSPEFSITTTGNTGSDTTTFASVSSGVYTITEIATTGWDLTDLDCIEDDSDSTVDLNNSRAVVKLDPGENVTCTFTNTKRGSLTIVKNTDGPNGEFAFTSSTLTSPFTITTAGNTGTQLFSNLPPDQYDVAELVPNGWQLTQIDCNSSPITIGALGVTLNLQPGENITCTFTNDPLPTATVTKTPDPSSLPEPGGLVVFTVAVQNTTAGEAIDLLSLVDAPFGVIADPNAPRDPRIIATDCVVPTTLAPADQVGDTYRCSFTVNLSGEPGNYTDTVTATLSDNEENEIAATGEAKVTITNVQPTAIMSKRPNPDTLTEPGGPVVFTVIVTNTSTVDALTLQSLSDAPYGDITKVQGDVIATTCAVTQTIAVNGGVYQCTFTVDLTGSAPGVYADTVTATLSDNDGSTIQPTAEAKVMINDDLGSIMVTKRADPATIPEPGGLVTFTVVVSNTSLVDSVTITEVVDNQFGPVCGGLLPVTLAPDEALECEFVRTITGNAGDTHTNTVTAKGSDDDGKPVTDADTEVVTITNVASAIDVTKRASVSEVAEPGANVTFTIEIENTSLTDSVTITQVVDSKFGDIGVTCQPPLPHTILIGEKIICEFTRFIGGNAGAVHLNIVTVTGYDDDDEQVEGADQEEVKINNVPSSIKVTKQANPNSVPEPGGTVVFTVVVTNTSLVDTVTIQQIVDDRFGNISTACGVTGQGVVLQPGATLVCTFTRTITGNAGGSHINKVTVSGVDDENNALSDFDTEEVQIADVPSTLNVTKTASRTSVPEPGADVTFTIIVENTSLVDNVTVNEVVDSQFGDISNNCLPALSFTLEPGATITCQLTEFISGAVGSTHVNVATATGFDDDEQPVTDSDRAEVEILDVPSSLTVIKLAEPTSVQEPGGNVVFTVLIENTSAVDQVTISEVVDSIFGDIRPDCNAPTWPTTLAPGATIRCTLTEPVGGNAGAIHQNTVTAKGLDDDGKPVQAQDNAQVDITNVLPDITVTKRADPATLPESGGIVAFTVVVVNNSTVEAATLTTLTDSVFGNLHGKGTCLLPQVLAAAGGSYTCIFSATISGDFGINHVNVVTATAGDDDGSSDTNTDDATVVFTDVLPQIEVAKEANQENVPETGGAVVYIIRVTNNSSEPATLTSLIDDKFGNLNGKGSCVVPQLLNANGGTYSCSFSATIAGAAGTVHTNVVTATASDDDGNQDSDSAQATVDFTKVAPNIQIIKDDKLQVDADNNGRVSPGDTLRYTIDIVNTGSGVATGAIFVDTPDPATKLVVGSVTTSKGTIDVGNSAGNTTVQVDIGTIQPNRAETIRIIFDVVIDLATTKPLLRNQGIVTVISGQSDDPDSVPSDDPSTPKVDDETITEVFAPTAEEETEEPIGSAIRRLFLPLIKK